MPQLDQMTVLMLQSYIRTEEGSPKSFPTSLFTTKLETPLRSDLIQYYEQEFTNTLSIYHSSSQRRCLGLWRQVQGYILAKRQVFHRRTQI